MTVKALKRVSNRDALAKTVRLLVKEGIKVQFRGRKAFVETRGDKIIRMVLPEIGDDANEKALKAIHGYLDHEVAHIYETPFGKSAKLIGGETKLQKMTNIVEDIRIEKLIPRKLPGTKTNLESLYEWTIPEIFAKYAREGVASGNPTLAFGGVMIPALRALAGQRAFQKFMDDENMWPHFMPLLAKMPDLSRRLRSMEEFEEALQLAKDIIEALKPQKKDNSDEDGEAEVDLDDVKDDQNDVEEAKNKPSDEKSDGSSDEAGDEESDEGEESDDGEGDGDGKGSKSDDTKSDKNCAGDDEDSDEGSGNTSIDGDDEVDGNGRGKRNVSITDALKQLDPTQRRAIFMYKKQRKSIREISEALEVDEEKAKDLIMTGRRRIREIIIGG